MDTLVEQLQSFLKTAWRCRWYAAGGAWFVAVAGWTALALLPNQYQASARVYVDTQSILRPLLAGLAMPPAGNQVVEMMSRTLISRPNVEKVVDMSGMDARMRSIEEREQTVTRLIRELTIKGTASQNFYTITYTDRDPEQAKKVVQSLLAIFVEGGVGEKRKDSDSARSFIDEQLETYGRRLTAAENAVADFKKRNLGRMPGQGQDFYARVNEAQNALNQARLELREAEQARDAIRKLRAASVLTPAEERANVEEPAQDAGAAALDARIQALQQRLDTLRLSYTDRHPDIVALLPMLEQLKEQKRAMQAARPAETRPAARPRPGPAAPELGPNPFATLAEYEANVASLSARVDEYERRLGSLKAAASAIPQVEAEYVQLTRDYEVTKHSYDQLMQRREAAQLTAEMQTNTGVINFRVIDPPLVPSAPTFPNRPLLATAILLAAIAGGLGAALLAGKLRPTILNEKQLREIAGYAVYGTVVMAWTGEQRRKLRIDRIVLAGCLAALALTYLVLMAKLVAQRSPAWAALLRGF